MRTNVPLLLLYRITAVLATHRFRVRFSVAALLLFFILIPIIMYFIFTTQLLQIFFQNEFNF